MLVALPCLPCPAGLTSLVSLNECLSMYMHRGNSQPASLLITDVDFLHCRIVHLAKAYIGLLREPGATFSRDNMQRLLHGVKVIDLVKDIVAAEIAGILVQPQDKLPRQQALTWELLQIHGFLSLESTAHSVEVIAVSNWL